MGGLSQSHAYLGLFLVVFALYANQIKKTMVPPPAIPKTAVEEHEPEVAVPAQARLQLLLEKFQTEGILTHSDGVSIIAPNSANKLKDEFVIVFSGDDVYSDGSFSLRETIHPMIDRIAEIIKKERGLRVELSGFADSKSLREKKAGDYGASLYAFSFARAEWLGHYFSSKHNIDPVKMFTYRGMGGAPKRKIELRFYYSTGFSGTPFSGAE